MNEPTPVAAGAVEPDGLPDDALPPCEAPAAAAGCALEVGSAFQSCSRAHSKTASNNNNPKMLKTATNAAMSFEPMAIAGAEEKPVASAKNVTFQFV